MGRITNERMMVLLKIYLSKIKKFFSIDKFIIFGSRARGDYFLDSDIDLIVVSKDFEDINFRKRMGILLEWWEGPVDLEVLCYTLQEFERKKKQIGIVKQAVKDGIDLI